MKNLFRYEIKKHIKVILAILLVIFIILFLESTFYRKADIINNSDIYNYAKSLLGTFIFIFIRLFLFGLFIYFGTDFIKNLFNHSNGSNYLHRDNIWRLFTRLNKWPYYKQNRILWIIRWECQRIRFTLYALSCSPIVSLFHYISE